MIDIKKLRECSKNFSVLYVEDDSLVRSSMQSYLLKLFFDVTTAVDGMDGLEKYKQNKFDLLITDISMPNMSGLEMIAKIKEINENQLVLITTAHTEADYMFACIKLGVDGYIIKPYDYDQLNSELFKIANKLNLFAQNEEYKTHLKEMVKKKTSEITKMMLFQNDNHEKTLISMVEMIEDRDTYTAGHSKRVAEYCQKIALEMGYTQEESTKLYQAGILHDVGKIATPDSVLLNPKNLNEIEYKLIQEHVEVGFRLLSHIPMFEQLAEIVHAHHERFDGQGYPRGIGGDEIPPLARIMIVADAFDAMTTNRIYKARKSVPEALRELQLLKSRQFHPEVVESALVALEGTVIDENISQIPYTKLEQERFAYFYKDRLTDVHNQNYLEIILMKNSYEKAFRYMDAFFVHNFSLFNKETGWIAGDNFLHAFANHLSNFFYDSLVFRVFGDDFVVMSKKKIEMDELKLLLDVLVESTCITYSMKSFDLELVSISSIEEIAFNG